MKLFQVLMNAENTGSGVSATETTIAPKADVVRESIPEKMAKLTAEQTELNGKLAAEGTPERATQDERLKVIARQLRWYQGRSGGDKAPKAARPSKAASSKGGSKKASQPATAATSQPATSAASES